MSSVTPSGATRTPGLARLNEDAKMRAVGSVSTDVDSSESFSEMSLSEEDMTVDDDEEGGYGVPKPRGAGTDTSPDEKERRKKHSPRSVRTQNRDRAPRSGHFAHEVKAAHALLHLHMQDATSEGLENDASADESACRSTLGLAFGPSNLASSRKRRRASL